jgi:hypothetical protein
LTLEEIKESVEHCKAVWCETGDPCYHCGQKEWLIKELEKLTNPVGKLVIIPPPTEEQVKNLFKKSINEVTNTWKMPIFSEPLTPAVVADTQGAENATERSIDPGPEGDQQLVEPGERDASQGPQVGSGG